MNLQRIASLRSVGISGLLGLAACNALLGTDVPDTAVLPTEPDAGTDSEREGDRPREDGALSGADAASPADAANDAAVVMLPLDCGDMSGLQAGAPWPTGGACNTRVSRAAVRPLVKPKIKWRYTVLPLVTRPSDEFVSGPTIGADGTVYASYGQQTEGGLRYFVVAVRDGALRFRTTDLPPNGCAPSLAADGSIFVSSSGGLHALTSEGKLRWTYPSGAVWQSSPTLLPDGTIIVAGPELQAVKPDGTKRWSLPPVGSKFVQSVAVTTTGLLVVNEAALTGTLEGSVSIVSAEGQRRVNLPLTARTVLSPLVTDDDTIVVPTWDAFHAFHISGAVKYFALAQGNNLLSVNAEYSAYAPPIAWFGGFGSDDKLLGFDVSVGGRKLAKYGDGDLLAAAGDGSLVSVRRSNISEVAVRGLDPDGKERWRVELEPTNADLQPPSLAADGSVVVAIGRTIYMIGD